MLAFYSRRCLATYLVTELASPPVLSYCSMFNRHALLLQTLVTSTCQFRFAPQNAHHECFLCARRVSPCARLSSSQYLHTNMHYCKPSQPLAVSKSCPSAYRRPSLPQTALFVYPPILPFINAPALPATKKKQQ